MPRSDRERRSTIADKLLDVIDERGLSGAELADVAGIPERVAQRFIARTRTITLETAESIAAALGLRLVESGERGRGRTRRPEKAPGGAAGIRPRRGPVPPQDAPGGACPGQGVEP